jgi:hypothetical protein
MIVNKDSRITLISGARLRRISDDGTGLLDQHINEGALVEKDIGAKVLAVIESKDKKLTAYMVEVPLNAKLLTGWVYPHEIAPSNTLT